MSSVLDKGFEGSESFTNYLPTGVPLIIIESIGILFSIKWQYVLPMIGSRIEYTCDVAPIWTIIDVFSKGFASIVKLLEHPTLRVF